MFEVKRLEKYINPTIPDLFRIKDEIDLEPYYQRYSDIWSLEKKRLLIDTVINGYDIPKFYLHYIIDLNDGINNSGKKFAVIDGKQRIKTLFDFLDGKFALDETVKYLDDETIKLNGKKYSDLDDDEYYTIKRNIDKYILDVIHIVTDENERIEEMFLRLNEGMPVNNAEKRNAIGGYLMNRINNLVKVNNFLINKVRFSNKRMQHQDLVTKLVLLESENNLTSFTKGNLDGLIKQNKSKSAKADLSVKRVDQNLEELAGVFDDNDSLLRYKGIIPLYYWFFKKKSPPKIKFRAFLTKFEDASF
jgi:hypothetical protein